MSILPKSLADGASRVLGGTSGKYGREMGHTRFDNELKNGVNMMQ